MPKACYFVLCPSIRAHKPSPENTAEQPLGWAGRVGDVDHWSTFLTRSTTGTEVHGIMPSSVMTRSTKSGGVTSYTKFSRPSEGTSCQCSSWVFPVRVTMRSSGSSGKDGRWIHADCRNRMESGQTCDSSTHPYLVHWTRRNPSAPFHKTCTSHNTPAQARWRLWPPERSATSPPETWRSRWPAEREPQGKPLIPTTNEFRRYHEISTHTQKTNRKKNI